MNEICVKIVEKKKEGDIVTGKTHFLGGLTAGLIASSALGLTLGKTIIITAVSGIGGLIPDIDHEKSIITQKTNVAGWAISRAFRHRGVLHTPIVYIILNAVLWLLLNNMNAEIYITGMFIGEISHLVLDSFNRMGIMWLWPLSKKRFHVLSVRSGDIADSITQAICFLIMVVVVLR